MGFFDADCRCCGNTVSQTAKTCPDCGASHPALGTVGYIIWCTVVVMFVGPFVVALLGLMLVVLGAILGVV